MRSTVPQDATTLTVATRPADAAAMQPAELRWAGAALALGGVLFVLGVILGLRAFGGEWDTATGPTLSRTAALIQENWPEFRLIWSGELVAALLLAAAAFLLQRRPQERRRWLPAAVAWIGVGTGSLLVAVSYAVTLGSYPAALASFDGQPALFAALRGASLSIHATGSVLQLLGLIGALAIEFRWPGRALPDRLVQAGAGVALLGFAGAVTGLVPGEFAAAGVFAAAALLGGAVWLWAGEPARGAHEVRAFLLPLIAGAALLGHGGRAESLTSTVGLRPQPVVLVITLANVVDLVSGDVLPDRTIVRDGWIVDVDTSDAIVLPPGATRIDADGQYLMPGLWDTHVHSAAGVDWHFPLWTSAAPGRSPASCSAAGTLIAASWTRCSMRRREVGGSMARDACAYRLS